jgi:hypothetical protein
MHDWILLALAVAVLINTATLFIQVKRLHKYRAEIGDMIELVKRIELTIATEQFARLLAWREERKEHSVFKRDWES